MSFRRGQSISNLIKSIKGNRGNVIPKATLTQIERIIQTPTIPKYTYDVLNLYHYLCFSHDENAFNRIDKIFFSAKNESTIRVSFTLAVRRLYCLIKYNKPYKKWLDIVREEMQEYPVTSTNLKFILNMSTLDNINASETYDKFYDEFLTIFQEELGKIDSLSFIGLRKNFIRNKFFTARSREVQEIIDNQINESLKDLTATQLKFLFQSHKAKSSQIYYYFLRFQSPIKRYGFLIHFMMQQTLDTPELPWQKFIREKYNKNEIIYMLPMTIEQPSPSWIIQRIFSYSINQRPYIDQFFEFKQIQVNGKVERRLMFPEKDYIQFLVNAYYYIFPGIDKPIEDQLNKIEEVLSEIQYLLARPNFIFVYFVVRHSVLDFRNFPKNIKIQKEKELITEIYNYLKMNLRVDYQEIKVGLLMPLYAVKNLVVLENELFQMPETVYVFKKLQSIIGEVANSISTNSIKKETSQIMKILNQYMQSKNPTPECNILFSEYKKHNSCLPDYQIWATPNPQINRTCQTSFMIKAKHIETKREVRYLLDFVHAKYLEENQKKVMVRKQWKFKYFREWCRIEYQVQNAASMEEYLASEDFKKIIKKLFA